MSVFSFNNSMFSGLTAEDDYRDVRYAHLLAAEGFEEGLPYFDIVGSGMRYPASRSVASFSPMLRVESCRREEARKYPSAQINAVLSAC